MNRSATAVILTAVSLLAGCGASSGSIDGTVDGRDFAVAEALSVEASDGTDALGIIVLSSRPGVCDALGDLKRFADTRMLFVVVGTNTTNGAASFAPKEAGEYPVVTAGAAVTATGAVATTYDVDVDADCHGPTSATGVSGSISITGVGQGTYAGRGDVTLDSGESIHLTFDTTRCDSILDLFTGVFAPTGCI